MNVLIFATIAVILAISINRAVNYNAPCTGWSAAWEHGWAKTLDKVLLPILIILIMVFFVVLAK